MKKSITNIRTDRWRLKAGREELKALGLTVDVYRAYVRALTGVVSVHWDVISDAPSQCAAIEKLIHRTKKNPDPKYSYFDKKFFKFPSYLRRAAIEAAVGQVSSFDTRYWSWQGGDRKRRDARPPKFTPDAGVYPVLYRGQCVKFHDDFKQAEIKIWNGKDWIWITARIAGLRKRHIAPENKQLSPILVVRGNKAHLSVPFDIPRRCLLLERNKVCGVDLGLNTAATAAIVCSDGTVTARRFIDRAADIDRRDKRLKKISGKARLTMGRKGKLGRGFCLGLYRKAGNINREMARRVAGEIVRFALEQRAPVIAFEQLEGWRPRGGRKRSTLRQRFHGWMHRQVVKLVTEMFTEKGGAVSFVCPENTSKLAFDGSGYVLRDAKNYALATFKTGKRYNADLNAAYNIGARYWYSKLAGGNGRETTPDKSFRIVPRMRVVLSTLWDYHRAVEHEAATTAASA